MKVASITGHKDLRSLQRYTHLKAEDLAEKLGELHRKIRQLRENAHLSQAVFAAVLNTSVSTVQKWEIGNKKPSGPSMKLLNLIDRGWMLFMNSRHAGRHEQCSQDSELVLYLTAALTIPTKHQPAWPHPQRWPRTPGIPAAPPSLSQAIALVASPGKNVIKLILDNGREEMRRTGDQNSINSAKFMEHGAKMTNFQLRDSGSRSKAVKDDIARYTRDPYEPA
jgi:DNA-binding transcriptional regulator YiaG